MRRPPVDLSYRTAITRPQSSPSAPSKWLYANGFIQGFRRLDYGCGKSKDAAWWGMDSYDPHFHPAEPKGRYDTILCTYVLNVVPRVDQPHIINRIKYLLKKNGKAYFTVTRSMVWGRRKNGTLQRKVTLDMPVIYRTGGYIIYEFSY